MSRNSGQYSASQDSENRKAQKLLRELEHVLSFEGMTTEARAVMSALNTLEDRLDLYKHSTAPQAAT